MWYTPKWCVYRILNVWSPCANFSQFMICFARSRALGSGWSRIFGSFCPFSVLPYQSEIPNYVFWIVTIIGSFSVITGRFLFCSRSFNLFEKRAEEPLSRLFLGLKGSILLIHRLFSSIKTVFTWFHVSISSCMVRTYALVGAYSLQLASSDITLASFILSSTTNLIAVRFEDSDSRLVTWSPIIIRV